MDEKSKLRFEQFKSLGSAIRPLALCSAIMMLLSCPIARSTLYLSTLLKLFVVFLYRLSILVLNHHFAFLLGNAVVVSLLLKFACDNRGDSESLIGDALLEGEEAEIELQATESLGEGVYPLSLTSPPEAGGNVRDSSEADDHQPPRRMEDSEKKRRRRDHLSNEEFQQEVEAFIERRRRFMREESLAVEVSA